MNSRISSTSWQFIRVFLTAMLTMLVLGTALGTGLNAQESNKKIYVYTDENGNTVFTDKAQPNAKQVDVKTNIMTMPATDTSVLAPSASDDEPKVKYELRITTPSHQQTIRDNSGRVDIAGKITPSLRHDYKYRLKLNGKQIQKPHASAHFVLTDVDRGEHSIVLELINDQQNVIATSEAVTFYLFRASILHNNGSQNQ